MPTNRPLSASVVIATYCRPDHVRHCLERITDQSVEPAEVVVVDSSPDDRTALVVAEWPRVAYLRNELGRGHTATSRAIGVAHTTGDVVAFLDDDAYAAVDWLAELLARYDDDVAAVGGRARNGVAGEESTGLDQIGLLLPDGSLTGNFAADPVDDVAVDHLLGANMSVRRDVVEQLGGIHDHFPGTCLREETDIALRARRAGWRIVFTPAAVVDHVAGTYAKGRRFDTRYQYYAARNHVVLLVHALGWTDPRTRRYLMSIAPTAVAEVWAAVRAPLDPDRTTVAAKVRGSVGALLRAMTLLVGSLAGGVAASALALDRTHRRTANRAD